jgi:hypothetical protein
MRDLKLMEPREFSYYVSRPGIQKDWSNPSGQELVESLNNLHRFTRQLVTEKERIQESLNTAQRGLESASLKLWILGAVVSAEFAIIGWLVKEFLAATR